MNLTWYIQMSGPLLFSPFLCPCQILTLLLFSTAHVIIIIVHICDCIGVVNFIYANFGVFRLQFSEMPLHLCMTSTTDHAWDSSQHTTPTYHANQPKYQPTSTTTTTPSKLQCSNFCEVVWFTALIFRWQINKLYWCDTVGVPRL